MEVHALTDMSVKDTQIPLKILISTTGTRFLFNKCAGRYSKKSSNDKTSFVRLVNEDTGAIVAVITLIVLEWIRSQEHVWLLYEDGRYILMFIVKMTLENDILVGQKSLKYQTKNMYL